MQSLPQEVCGEIDEYERELQRAKQRMAVSKNGHIIMFGDDMETLLTSWSSFNIHFGILLTLCCTRLMPCAMPITVMHMFRLSVQRSLRCT